MHGQRADELQHGKVEAIACVARRRRRRQVPDHRKVRPDCGRSEADRDAGSVRVVRGDCAALPVRLLDVVDDMAAGDEHVRLRIDKEARADEPRWARVRARADRDHRLLPLRHRPALRARLQQGARSTREHCLLHEGAPLAVVAAAPLKHG